MLVPRREDTVYLSPQLTPDGKTLFYTALDKSERHATIRARNLESGDEREVYRTGATWPRFELFPRCEPHGHCGTGSEDAIHGDVASTGRRRDTQGALATPVPRVHEQSACLDSGRQKHFDLEGGFESWIRVVERAG